MSAPPLTGTLLVDLTHGLAGPLTTMHPGALLAELGRRPAEIAALVAEGAAVMPAA